MKWSSEHFCSSLDEAKAFFKPEDGWVLEEEYQGKYHAWMGTSLHGIIIPCNDSGFVGFVVIEF